ncbi:hypothetical protein GXB81_25140 [Paraburkholderia sp. Ac-20336]|uniref:hypothetical protein n=1 Tax=Burkholderiaceae TaxID=119060 RepID=UPI0014216D8D|nr:MULTISPECIES: hypothetical protein [Burkholderiaceae]MBN3806315.1 hypothetical protein [Paraburkholderia sp. Ac-20336]MBN3851225.1 hypothetical protein [Paraburkholderia sp. Ac-20342]NIF54047.1 hypothetical protein [Burkholderia sp. Ax-1724]
MRTSNLPATPYSPTDPGRSANPAHPQSPEYRRDSGERVREFQARLNATVSALTNIPPGQIADMMRRASLRQLQDINERIRTWVASGMT